MDEDGGNVVADDDDNDENIVVVVIIVILWKISQFSARFHHLDNAHIVFIYWYRYRHVCINMYVCVHTSEEKPWIQTHNISINADEYCTWNCC